MIDVGALFPGASRGVYLNTASMALGSLTVADALKTAIDEWSVGRFDWIGAQRTAEDLRARVASLLGASTDDIAFVTGAGGGSSTVAAQLPQGLPGANVVVPARDYATNFLPWMLLRDRGYELRVVEDADGTLSPDAFARLVDRGTAVVATSLVQSATGFRCDLDSLKTIATDANAWLVVDASQAFGSIEIDIAGIDALFSCSHKWLLGVRGMGHLYVHPELRDSFVPITPGWNATADPMESFYGPTMELSSTAAKLDGSFPWFDPIANNEGLRILGDIGIGTIEAHNRSLIDDLESRGVAIPFESASRSPIVSIEVTDTEETVRALDRDGIVASIRSGRLRASVHLYNTHEDIEKLANAVL